MRGHRGHSWRPPGITSYRRRRSEETKDRWQRERCGESGPLALRTRLGLGTPSAHQRLLYFAVAEAPGAYPDALRHAIDDSASPLQVSFPSSVGNVVSVADAVTTHCTLIANLTSSGHDGFLSLDRQARLLKRGGGVSHSQLVDARFPRARSEMLSRPSAGAKNSAICGRGG